jgi:hypothetical protein
MQNATKEPRFLETTRMILKSTQTNKKGEYNSESKIFSITNIFKGYKMIDLTRPNELGTKMNKVATRSIEEHSFGNDYVPQVATQQTTLYSATLFSSKEERSASKIGVSGIA